MEFKERIVLILAWLRYIGENYPSPYGTKVSYIREAMKTRNKADILDADIKYLFDKDYIENWYTPPDAKKWPYMYGMDYLIKITARGIDYLEEEKSKNKISPQVVQYIQSGFANVSGSGNAYSQVNINNTFKQVYNMIEQETKENPEAKEELIKEIKDIEEELKNNNFEKIKQKLSKLKEKAKFLFPVLQQIVVEVFKNWVGV